MKRSLLAKRGVIRGLRTDQRSVASRLSFKPEQRQRAIDAAQQLAKRPDVAATKVIREIFDESLQRMKETTIFHSDSEYLRAGSLGVT